MQAANYQSLKISPNSAVKIDDFLVVEAPLQININNEPYTVVMRTPNSDFELIKEISKIPAIINVDIQKDALGKGYLNKRTLLSVSSCGICGKRELEDLNVVGKSLE